MRKLVFWLEGRITHGRLKFWAALLEFYLQWSPNGSDVICERWLIVPVLQIIESNPGIRTSTIIKAIRDLLEPDDYADEILPSRSDARINQLVRNLRSHRTLERYELATYHAGEWNITPRGQELLRHTTLN